MAYRVFSKQKPEAISLIHEYVGETEYSLHILEKDQLNIAEQLQLERILGKSVRFPYSKLYTGMRVVRGSGYSFSCLLLRLSQNSKGLWQYIPEIIISSENRKEQPACRAVVSVLERHYLPACLHQTSIEKGE
ncbi:hypothetical protein PEC18_09975 [Paucibacter sp. O1-1]|nr:hypothetical protein [Paucibacter sp. O1-1]MDA3826175.1 hypothetical protein [Paucibacter sp. O1-1]